MPYYGFNFQWMFSHRDGRAPEPADARALDFLAAHGFNFVRVPLDYWFWTRDFDYFHPDERVFDVIDAYVAACRSRGLHLSLNLHRAPGYCINGNDRERHNLWLDSVAQDAFVFLWETFATRYRDIPGEALSFDLVNEPPQVGQYGMTRENHAAIVRRTTAAIRALTPERPIAIDGLAGGNLAMPELVDLNVTHSGRAYQPYPVSHWGAEWSEDWRAGDGPTYPGTRFAGHVWDRETLRAFYQPWRDVEAAGATVHIGEFGCYNQTPNDSALRWFADLFALFKAFGWGYAMWNFEGAFGIIDHGRPGAVYENMSGYRVDRALFDLMLDGRV